jgi:hypothetical protein
VYVCVCVCACVCAIQYLGGGGGGYRCIHTYIGEHTDYQTLPQGLDDFTQLLVCHTLELQLTHKDSMISLSLSRQ